jgi:uncharacterized protein (DUF488 family)
MLFKRQKILLALIEEFGGYLKSTDLQKYLFLLSCNQQEKSYYFIPYKYGCFSFRAYHDKRTLTEKGFLVDSDDWKLSKKGNFREMLSFEEARDIWQTKKDFAHLTGDQLVKYVYENYPYYAINSEVATRILKPEELLEIDKQRPCKDGLTICSIGYEGKTLEEYLNILIQEDVKILCDVRRNPISRKYGFSQKTLMNALERLGIEYNHYPELGIASDKRGALVTQADYDALFAEYENTVLKKNFQSIKCLNSVLKHKKRIAVTCFEKLPQQCHRTIVAKAVLRECTGQINFLEV